MLADVRLGYAFGPAEARAGFHCNKFSPVHTLFFLHTYIERNNPCIAHIWSIFLTGLFTCY
ncbi:hypothetical protein K523DRAFT_347406 [Schizophyllum commune Tattone D]|nr:hypothetical protein K523DRAFT_347406 [Schizophyllum commune Tattone D]